MSSEGRLAELERRQSELQQREREILEHAYLRRANGFDTVRDALRRLGELGSPTGVLARAPQELGAGSEFDRVLLSEVSAGRLTPLTLWERGAEQPPVPDASVALEYPLVEYEVARNRRAELVSVAEVGARSPKELATALGWSSYALAPIVVESELVGMMHADASASARALDELDRELLAAACTGLGEVLARAVLRETLQRHRIELQTAIAWLSHQLQPGEAGNAATTGADRAELLLTGRERQILVLMSRGQTNGQIASALGVREGTVKYHVKNILRKLGARSRSDAVARYVRFAGGAA